ncbi:hypothetical protein WAI453_000324 [Rhynchosporium graminicola]|uniref:Uncharacterized protein n=1 Tax=Rhynchosporium graminicola TaxID=2792576 RepID=A0A1E1JQB5_9HELO|nr:uncharacterized protein RCO7_00884 [Rhynchosporium commune]
MASLILARGLHSLIATRDTTPNQNTAWNTLLKRNNPEHHNGANVAAVILAVVNIIIIVPIFLIVVYTIDKLYPMLVIVEADSPPEYELVARGDSIVQEDKTLYRSNASKDAIVPDNAGESSSNSSSSNLMPDETAGVPAASAKPITSSLIATLRLLYASGGGLYKGFRWRCLSIVVFSIVLIVTMNIPFIHPFVVVGIATLATAKIETAWTHNVISSQRDGFVYRNLPSYLTILKATAIPITAKAVVSMAINTVAMLSMGSRKGSLDPLGILPQYEKGTSILALSALFVTIFTLQACLLVPVEVMLVRTRAAMLSEDVSTLVPMDASIRAQSTEAMGFLSFLSIWQTFSRASWIRIVKANFKGIGASVGIEFAVALFISAQVLIFEAIAVNS